MDERQIIAALLRDRNAYDRLSGRLDPRDFGEFGQFVVRAAADFYKRDPAAACVDVAVLESALRRALANPKHADAAVRYLGDLPTDVSVANVVAEYRLLRRHNVGLELAAALGTGKHGDATDALVDRYRELGVEHDSQADKLSLEELADTVGEGNQIRLLPGTLNERVGGGVLRGHNITIFGRPESGKTAFAVNLAAGFLRAGLRVLYTGNEEPVRDLQLRFLARLAGVSLREIKASPDRLRHAADKAGPAYDRLLTAALVTGKVAEVESLVRLKRPDVLVVDQLKNLKMPGSGNRAEELDNIAREIRRLGAAYNMLTVSVTQAGAEAEGEQFLGMTDIEWSNTGIPGAADLLIGIGRTDALEAAHKRMISLPKNKISGNHAPFPVFVDFDYNLFRSKPKERNYT